MSDPTTDYDPPVEDNRPLTICTKCKHCVKQTAGCVWEWACNVAWKEPQIDFVTGNRLNPIFMWCKEVNDDGHCPWYEAKK